jgi:type IV secretion system protein VirB9
MKQLLLLALLVQGYPASARDARITTRSYDPSVVVAIDGHVGIESTIEFGPDEHIENVAVGDSATWQVTPNKSARLLFVKPMHIAPRTNLTVVTDRRTYLFDLVSVPKGDPLYMLRFTYPQPLRPPVVSVAAIVKPSPPPAPKPVELSMPWSGKGRKELLPARMFDDGHSVWLSWPKDRSLPAILTTQADGSEGAVNYSTRGDYIVVDGVPSQLTLRRGKREAILRPDRQRSDTPTSYPAQKPSDPIAQEAEARL